jgi:hypothetical protein
MQVAVSEKQGGKVMNNRYFLLGISHAVELSKAISLILAATAGYLTSTDADKYPTYDGNAMATTDKFSNFHDGTVPAGLPVKVSDRIRITPTLSYIVPMTGDAKDEMKGYGLKGTAPSERASSDFIGGIQASFSL